MGKGLAIAAAAIVLTLLAILSAAWVLDVRSDRKHTLAVKSSTPLFEGAGDVGGCHGEQMTMLAPNIMLPVRRIHYLKDCATVDVTLPDGRQGYVVLGVGDVAVNPPLPNR